MRELQGCEGYSVHRSNTGCKARLRRRDGHLADKSMQRLVCAMLGALGLPHQTIFRVYRAAALQNHLLSYRTATTCTCSSWSWIT